MTQLSLFSQAELTGMRDRTKDRNYSPERDAFRRDHQRRRDHGKAQRHAERIYRAFHQSRDDEPPRIPPASGPPRIPPASGPPRIPPASKPWLPAGSPQSRSPTPELPER